MKWSRLFLLFFLIPNLIYASFYLKEYQKVIDKISAEWNRHEELLQKFNSLTIEERQQNIGLLNEAIACCERAIARCDYILDKIAHKIKEDRKEWEQKKQQTKENKRLLHAEIENLRGLIHQTAHFSEAIALYQESGKKANLASLKIQECDPRLNNVEEVVFNLNAAANLFEEALSHARHALNLISPYSDEGSKNVLREAIEQYLAAANKYKQEAADWPAAIAAHKAALKDNIAALKEDSRRLRKIGLYKNAYEVQMQIAALLEKLIEGSTGEEAEILKEEMAQVKAAMDAFEKEADNNRFMDSPPLLSPDELSSRETPRREAFFHDSLALKPAVILHLGPRPNVIPLDGQTGKTIKDFNLYTEQFYRFLVQSDTPVSHLLAKVLENGEVIYEEKIDLPLKNTLGWERYLTTDGMVFIPQTKLKADFGIDLRLKCIYDPQCNYSLMIAQKAAHPGYQLSISLGEGPSLYVCDLVKPPPWQLGSLRKPALADGHRSRSKTLFSEEFSLDENNRQLALSEPISYPLLDQLIEELKGDPLALASYVYHEIAFVDPFVRQENGIFYPPLIHRNILRTYLEKKGSPWEQCQLLAHLLRKAGYPTVYVTNCTSFVPKTFAEKLLLIKLPVDQTEASLCYPWLIFFDGKEWISLFPWMKEIQIEEGHDLYGLMPEEYSSADRWILRYLKADEAILKHVASDGDDTAGSLFTRFVEEQLKQQGLSSADVGLHRLQLRRQFSSWEDFPRPLRHTGTDFLFSLNETPQLFAKALIEFSSRENPQNKISCLLTLADIGCGAIPIHFSPQRLHSQGEVSLELNETDHFIDVKVSYGKTGQTLTVAKGTSAALCFHFGGASPELTSHFYEHFASEKDEKKRLYALLAFVGASYFEKCGRAEESLSSLHKIRIPTTMAFGLATFSPHKSKGLFLDQPKEEILPQVDMFWFCHRPESHSVGAYDQYLSLALVNQSSYEHQILREVFKDPYAVSTVKLLQLAHLEQLKKGLEGDGFLVLTHSNLDAAKEDSSGQLSSLLGPENPLHDWAYAYMTPGFVSSADGFYKEMGALIFHPIARYALISHNNLFLNGGLGSPLPPGYFTLEAIRGWQLVPMETSYTLRLTAPPSELSIPGTTTWSSDVRSGLKTVWNQVSDPVDTVTGVFYIDETDLVLPGPFSLAIGRNYNSQNPLITDMGCGWKLSLNPYLIEQDGKRFAAEPDGTVIVYAYNKKNSRWEVFSEDNPELFNFKGMGGRANPFHAYIENDVLYGSDGSKRYFEDGLLKKWVDVGGNNLTFLYDNKQLSRIEGSNGDYCGFHYNHEGKISEIYAKDGRRISYGYDSRGDLIKVTLPNSAVITYEYDRVHRIIRETKPHGKVLKNKYDEEGRVKEQKSPMGPQQEMIVTATFDYAERMTTVTDAGGAKTTYKIFQKQIYRIIDPLGYETLQSWFIDENSWFDAETEQVVPWNQPGGAVRSLKSTTDKRGLATHYLYDSRGNPEVISLHGKDLTGSGETAITKNLVFNDLNLCIEEEVCGQKTKTIYDQTFPHLPKRIEKYSGTTLISSIDWEYNSQGLVEKEDHSGSVTLWKYYPRGLPREKIQPTGTLDPDVVTTYAYNLQGQCIKITSADAVQENEFDLMGNLMESRTFSPSGVLLSATYVGYNLNNMPIWKQAANAQNTLYFDYHASGLINATRQNLAPSSSVAYTLYTYDPCGYLIEEIDPRGYCTYREYDAIGQMKSETKEGHTTLFTYESGGLPETITSPSGAKTTRRYTTNGLLKEEILPDGTRNSIVYDFFGRPVLETKNDLSWEITYDDANHRVIRTQLNTKFTETSQFDARGNLLRYTDAAGYTSEKTYDSLNRIKTETTPSGKQTLWSYQGGLVICMRPNAETATHRYEGGRIADSQVTDAQGTLIAHSHFHYDPETDLQRVVQGEEVTTTWMNALGLPIKVQKGNISTIYEYDARGNCIAITDGDGRVTHQKFDGLGRMRQKELPDGSVIGYVYDPDSNLAEYHLPDGTLWKASYDSMGRKYTEELQAGRQSSHHWEFIYENGYLKEAKDPMHRVHTYTYESSGRLSQEIVDGGSRTYTYDPRGFIATAEQTTNREDSFVERSYDADGHLFEESIYLNSHLIQQTTQTWDASSRSLQIGGHTRDFVYQNHRLARVSTSGVDLSYTYDPSGSLKSKSTPWSTTVTGYNASGLPENVQTKLPSGSYQETLEWYSSGKLFSYSSPMEQKQFTYTPRGYLQAAGAEEYDWAPWTGVRTAAPGWIVPQNGLDAFGKILAEIIDKNSIATTYTPMGEVKTHGQRLLGWDPWGRLIKISDRSMTWEASYDAFGRRLQTRYVSGRSSTLTMTSFYDPEEEFQEIGVKYGDKMFWKIYGPNSCDAVTDQTGASVVLMHDALDKLVGVVSQQGIVFSEQLPSSYGPQSAAVIPSDLLSYAQSLTWHSQAQDPTGLIWMGERYYDPKGGRFLSPDPVGHPICMDLYAYAGGDPVNYLDRDGRFASAVYQITSPVGISFFKPYEFNAQRMWSTVGGISHGVVDFIVDNVHSLQSDMAYMGFGDMDLTLQERVQIIDVIEHSQANRTAMLGGWMMGMFSVDESDTVYHSFRSMTTSGLELAYLATGVYGAAKGWNGLNKLARMPVKMTRISAKGMHGMENALRVGNFKYANTAANHITDLVKRGRFKGELSRPYMKSPHTINEIMAAGKPIPDPGRIPGGLRWDVPGTFRGSEGTWELVLHPESEIIYHFNFK